MRIFVMLAALQLAISPVSAQDTRTEARKIIQASIQAYPGSCPCPYNRDRAGRRCGGRSAWSKPGGYAPICYAEDITPQVLNNWRARQSMRIQ